MVQALRIAALGAVFACSAAAAQNIPTCTVTAAPITGTGPTDVTLTWTAMHASTCVATGGWSGPKDCAGGTQVRNDVGQTSTFTLKVTAPTGKVTARWTKPLQNEDGTPMTVKGYQLFIADAATGLPSATAVPLPATPLEYVFWRSPGNVSAGIKAVRSDNVTSGLSNIAGKTVVAASGSCAATVTISPRPKAPALTISKLWDKLTGRKPQDPS